jgi:phosphate transport system permease protein
MLTSSILGVARAAGETAPIMFTAAFAIKSELPWENLESWGDFFFQGVMALPYHIYILSKIPQNEYSIGTQYGTAFVFLILILILTSLSMIFRFRMRNKQKIFQS